jgi:hypothetical protein
MSQTPSSDGKYLHPSTRPSFSLNGSNTGNTGNSTRKPAGYVFACPTETPSSDCELLHPIKRNPDERAFAATIMDHIRIDRKNRHLNSTPLTAQEAAAVSTQEDPYGQKWVRSGNNRTLFMPGGIYNDWGFALIYYPEALSNGEKGDWDVVTLSPSHQTVAPGVMPSL